MARRLSLLVAAAVIANGCGKLGRTEIFTVSIVDDTGVPVVVRDCSGYCGSSPIALRLQPGGSAPIHRVANDHKYFSITTASGAHAGCLDLYYRTPEPGAQALVSHAIPCPGGSGPPWRTIGLVLLALSAGLVPLLVVLTRRRR
jgi:hypothetical protein